MKKKLLIVGTLAAVAAAAALLLGRQFWDGGAEEVQVATLAPRSIQASVLASGHLVHEEEVLLTTEVIGRVTGIYVEEGDRVAAGQLLLQIDDEIYRAAVEQNEATVRMQEIAIQRQQVRADNLRTQWERQRALHERNLIDDDSFDAVTNELNVAEIDLQSSRESLSQAEAQLEQAADRLSKTRVVSPIGGTVTSLDIKVGETAISSTTNIPGSSLMTIANPASIHAEVNVDEADIANVAVGQKAQIFAIAYPDRPMEGVIDSIAVSAKVAEGAQGLSFAVKIRLEKTNRVVLRPGMSCRVEIYTDVREGILAVPIQAIIVDEIRSENRITYHVFEYEDRAARRVEVQVGLSDDTWQAVTGGLSEGDEVIVGPDRVLRSLADGDRVTAAAPE
ncbi:MAG: efflux RND transporter periplasmic adaptor subunit [Rhodospirillaceae bacterium]|nr:efflux RND transporter periplasmic adaptor subunit [Rhodospirillaceae bacterium]